MSRDAILAKIRARTSKGDEETRRMIVDEHLAEHRRNLIPARGQGDDDHRIGVFTRMMEAVGGTVELLDDVNDVPHSVAAYLRNGNLPAHIRRGADPLLAKLPWHRGGAIEVEEGRAAETDRASITPCLRRHCRVGHHHPGLGPRQPDDAQLPARGAYRGAGAGQPLRQL